MNQIQKTRKLNIDRNKGFTLVEMIVVLAMMAIVMTLTVFGILAWQDWADFNRENEYAETLFVAAQNQLAEFSANGRLQEMKASLYGFDSVEEYKIANENPDLNLQIGNEYKYGNGKENDALELNTTRLHKIKNVDGVSYNEVNIWPEAYKQEKNQSNYTDKIVSLRAEAGQYNEYLNDPDAFKKKDLDAYWLFEILGDYVYDTSIIAGSKDSGTAICLEFTISNGQVFSVLYSDKKDFFRYESFEKKVTTDKKYADISDRSETVRMENMVGYYGVDTLYAATPTDVEKPGISYVALIDDNYYYLKMRLSERYRNKTGELDYTIDLNGSKNQEDKVMTIEIANGQLQNMDPNRTTLAERAEYALTNNGTITGQVTLYGEDGITPKMEADGVTPKKLNYEFIGWVDSDYYIHLILDAADMQAQTKLYKDEFSTILAGSENQNFDKTFSYFRFGVPIKNLWVSVTAEGDGVPRSKTVSNFGNINPTKNQSATNPVYQLKRDYVQGGKLAVTYDISNPRHLYNIRYNSDITLANRQLRDDFYYDKEEKAYASTDVSGITYNFKNDIAWAEFQQAGYLMNGYAAVKRYPGIQRYTCDYPSYAQMNVKDVIEGNNFKVSGISIKEEANLLYGCVEDITATPSENKEYTSAVSQNCPTGFVNVNYGSVKDLKLDQITVSGNSMVGAFVGANVGEVERLVTVKNNNSYVYGTKDVGGIIGFELPSGDNTLIQFCENNISVTGQEAVGGIIGMVRNEFSNVISGTNINDNPILAGVADSATLLNKLNTKTGQESLSIEVNKCDNYGPIHGEFVQLYSITTNKVPVEPGTGGGATDPGAGGSTPGNRDCTFYIQHTQDNDGYNETYKLTLDNHTNKVLEIQKIELVLDGGNKASIYRIESSGNTYNGVLSEKKLIITPHSEWSQKIDINSNGKREIDIHVGFNGKENRSHFKIHEVKITFAGGETFGWDPAVEVPHGFVSGGIKNSGQNAGGGATTPTPTPTYKYVPVPTKIAGGDSNIRYLGGIVGYCYNQFENPEKIIISDCTSCPQYEAGWLFDMLGDNEKLTKYLKGYYVGGIVGFNQYGEIKVCASKSTRAESGYIFGNEFVGGIVGLNIGPASGIAGGTSVKQGRNANNVIGNKYAGGIVGCNANITANDTLNNPITKVNDRVMADPEKLAGILIPDTTTCLNVKIDNWLNEGVVIAKDSYSGGISGYNAGWIYNCNTKISEADANKYFNKLYTKEYAGGITGYNNGVVGNTKRETLANGTKSKKAETKGSEISIRSYVRGRNYVGGIVGYNDVDSIVEDYKVTGGYVYGEEGGCYVGGYAGFNASVDLLMDTESKQPRSIKSSPNNVEGGYFVGGIIGGNIINTNGFGGGPTKTYTDPYEAADKQDPDKVYAELKFGNMWQEGSTYKLAGDVYVHNKSNGCVTCWSIPLDQLDDTIVVGSSNYAYDASKKVLRWNFNNAWSSYVEAGQDSPGDSFTFSGDKNKLENIQTYYTNHMIPVKFFDATDNEEGSIWGASIDPTTCTSYVSNSQMNQWDGNTTITIENNTGNVLPNWRVEMDLPEGATLSGVSYSNSSLYGQNGTVAYVTGNQNGIILPKEKVNVTLYYAFDSRVDDVAKNKLVTQTPRISFNNVTFGTNATPGGSGSSSGSGSGSSSGSGSADAPKIEALFETDNFLGTLTGDAYVGGFVGYSMLVNDKDVNVTSLPEGNRGLVYLLQKSVVERFKEINPSGKLDETKKEETEQKLHDMTRYLDNIQDNFVNTNAVLNGKKINSEIIIHMTGEDHLTRNSLGTIKAKIYVGGVAGYVDENTKLYVQGVDNATPIIATSSIKYIEQQPLYVMQEDGTYQKSEDKYRTTNYAGAEFTYEYSYAGGIVGKVGAKTTIDACSNVSLGRVTTYGTYTGGICEVNEGTIINCQVTNIGNGATDYVGGLCGLNLNMIQDCKVKNQTVTGRNVVGAIVAENFGTIQGIELDEAKIMAYSSLVAHNDVASGKHFYSEDGVSGLLAAYNGNSGIISLEKDIKNVSVLSKGRYVGLAVGFNDGSVSNNKPGAVTADKFKAKTKAQYKANCETNLTISGTIEGRMTVGSLIGCNNDANPKHNIYNYTNLATVKSSHGEAGGLIGVNSSANTMMFCENRAMVVATDGGNAGGLTSINDGTIAKCFDYNAVSAPNGMCGGIVALNDKNGNIYDCFVEPDSKAKSVAGITFTSTQVVGGIAAQNGGTISGNFLKNVTITNDTTKMYTKMGVVVGENLSTGKILLSNSSQLLEDTVAEIDACKVVVESNNCKVGGIAGTNAGTISGNAIKTSEKDKQTIGEYQITSLVTCDLQLKNATYAAMGGVAGVNTGEIRNVSVDAKIHGNLGTDDSGYGGIAGVNGFTKSGSKEKSIISYCTFDGEVSAKGSSGMLARVGGIVGLNGYGSKVEYCGVGVRGGDSSENKVTLISAGNLDKDNTTTGTDKESSSYTGGIAGENYGQIADIDAVNTSKDTVKIIAFAGSTGGIAGHNCVGATISGYIENKGKSNEKIHRVATGNTWFVEMRCAENNRGPGGIIGLNESGKSIEYVDNYAHVLGSYKANMKTGGLIGENMQIEVNQLHLSNCNNFGLVEGWANTGGFIGHDWYRGAVFNNCRNYGEIRIIETSTAEQRFVAGFIGRITAVETALSFVDCENHGNIWCNGKTESQGAAGGFIGQSDTMPKDVVNYITNCVNTGIIIRDETKKLTGSFIGDCKAVWDINMCRNYNTNLTEGGFCSSGSAKTVFIHNSLDVSLQQSGSGNNKPFGGIYSNAGTKSLNNYYIAASSHTTDKTIMFLTSNYDTSDGYIVGYTANGAPVMGLRKNDPLRGVTYKADKSLVSVSRSRRTGDSYAYVKWDNAGNADIYSDETDSRISVYKEMDRAFVEYIVKNNKTDKPLSAPENVEVYIEKGLVNVKWDRVTTTVTGTPATPYGYEVHYDLYDKEGNWISEKSEIQLADNTAKEIWHTPISIEKEWLEGNYTIVFKVKAINAYRYMENGDDSLDSDWSEITEHSKYVFSGKQLIMPEVHIEVTAGNKMVAILDNLDEYENSLVMVKDESGLLVAKPMSDVCIIEVSFNAGGSSDDDGTGFNYTIDPKETIVSDQARYVPDEVARRLRVKAVPKEEFVSDLTESETNLTYGKAHTNSVLPDKDSYSTDTFFGFFGTDASSMVYQIGMKGGDDSFLTTDIGAYDEEVGTYVYYGRDLTHVGSSAGGDVNLISTLKNLPQGWFDEDTESSIEARVYLDSAQNKLVRYGHNVISGITLYSESISMNAAEAREKNIEILKDIKDPYYLAKVSDDTSAVEDISDFLKEDLSIWGNNDLRYGYVLYRNEDGTYDVIYNATIELSRKNADKYTEDHAGDQSVNDSHNFAVERKYYRYDVDSIIYASMEEAVCSTDVSISSVMTAIPKESIVNTKDFNQTYQLRWQKNDNGDPRYNSVKITNNETKYIQEIMPAPIVDKDAEGNDITITETENGKEYKVSWDTYYRDSVTNVSGNYVAVEEDNSIAGMDDSEPVYKLVESNSVALDNGVTAYTDLIETGEKYVIYLDAKGNKVYAYPASLDQKSFFDFTRNKFRYIPQTAKTFGVVDDDGKISNKDLLCIKYNDEYYYTTKDNAFISPRYPDKIYYYTNAKQLYKIDENGALVESEQIVVYNKIDGYYYYSTNVGSFISEDGNSIYATKTADIKNFMILNSDGSFTGSNRNIVNYNGKYYFTKTDTSFLTPDGKALTYGTNVIKPILEFDENGVLTDKGKRMLHNEGTGAYYYSKTDRSFVGTDGKTIYYFSADATKLWDRDEEGNLEKTEKTCIPASDGNYYGYKKSVTRKFVFFDDTTRAFYYGEYDATTPVIKMADGKYYYSSTLGAYYDKSLQKFFYDENGVQREASKWEAKKETNANNYMKAGKVTVTNATNANEATKITSKVSESRSTASNSTTSNATSSRWWVDNINLGTMSYSQNDLKYLSFAGQTITDADGKEITFKDFPTWKAFRERTATYDDYLMYLYNDTNDNGRRDYIRGMMNSYFLGYDSANYKVELIGTTDAGDKVVLDTEYVYDSVKGESYQQEPYTILYKKNGEPTTTKKKRYAKYETWNYETTFVDKDGSWEKYKNLSVEIMRIGQDRNIVTMRYVDDAGKVVDGQGVNGITTRLGKLNAAGTERGTLLLPRYSTASVVQQQRLDTVDTPDAEMTQINGQFITEYPSYDISWMLNTDEEQLKDLAGYLLKIEDASKEDILPSTYYYIPEDESFKPDYESLTISANELEHLLDTVTGIKVDRNDETHTNTVSVNFVEYAGRNVKVTVRAMARKDSESNPRLYLNGYASTAKEITIKDSLSAPDVSLLKLAVADDSEKETDLVIPASEEAVAGMPDFANAKTIIGEDANQETIEHAVDSETYEKGFTFHYAAGTDKTISVNYADENKQDVKLNIAIALYDSKDDASATDKSRGKAGDAESVSENGYWNSGAIKTLYSKSEPFNYGYVRFDGVADTESNVSLTALEEYVGLYAGKWMKIALQATSESNIDSLWSDEDRTGMTQNYIWIQIPKMILKDVDLSVGSAERWYHETIIEKDGQSYIESRLDREKENESDVHFVNRTLSFEEDPNADGWHIGISVKAPKPEDSVSGNDAPSGTTSGNSASGNNAPSGTTSGNSASGNNAPSGSASGNSASGDNEPSGSTSGNGTPDGNSSDNGVSGGDKEAKETPVVIETDNDSTDKNSEAVVDNNPEEIKDSDNLDEPEQKKFWVVEFFENLFHKSDSESEEAQVKEAQIEEITESQTEEVQENESQTEETQIKESKSDEIQKESEMEETRADETEEIKVVEAQEEKSEGKETEAEEAEVKKTVVISGQIYEVREVENDSEDVSDSEKSETVSGSDVNELNTNKVDAKESEDDEAEDSISDNQIPEDDVQDVLAGEEPEDSEEILPLYELYFDKHVAEDGIFDGTWDVFIAAGNDETTVSANAAADGYTCSQNSVAVYLGTIGTSTITGAPAEVQYISITDVSYDITIEHLTYHMYAELAYDGDKKEFTLILPDVAGFDADDNYDESDDCCAVEQVVVEKLVSPDNECYVRGLSGGFERSESQEEEGIFVYQTFDMYKSDVESWYEKKRKVK